MANLVSPKNTDSLDLDALAQAASTTGLHAAAGDSVASSGGPSPGLASTMVQEHKADTATRSSVASSATDVLLLAANTSRKGAVIYNQSTQILYLGLGSTVTSSTNYTEQVASNTRWVMPFPFTDEIRGLWASANGDARVTELT